jgi:hypothetical protein
MVPQLQQCYDIYHTEQNDQYMDQQIIQEQHQKQESARTIAQRLNALSSSNPKVAESSIMDTETTETSTAVHTHPKINTVPPAVATMEEMDIPSSSDLHIQSGSPVGEDDGSKRKKKTSSKKKSDTTTTTKNPSWDEIQSEWYTLVKPIQLALDLILQWVSLVNPNSNNSSSNNDNEEREISIPLSALSSRMDVDNDDDEYDTTAMNMDDDDDYGDSHYNSGTVKVLHRVLCTCNVFCTVHELNRFLLPWYQSLRTTTGVPLTPPIQIILDTVSDLLCKAITVIGQMYASCDNTFDTNVTLSVWNECKDLLTMNPHSDTTAEPTPSKGGETMMMTIPVENVTVMENMYVSSITTELLESVTSTMVGILRSGTIWSSRGSTGSSSGSTRTLSSSHVLMDLVAVLQCRSRSDMVSRHSIEPIVIRDLIGMIGMILSESSSASSSSIPDKDIEMITGTLLQTSTVFVEALPELSSGSDMIVSVSDIDDDTSNNGMTKIQPSTSSLSSSFVDTRKSRLMIGMEIMNVLMDIYSDDDVVGSLKYNLFYTSSPDITMISVRNYYEHMVPILQQELWSYQQQQPKRRSMVKHTAAEEEEDASTDQQMLEVWEEIIENSIRFVEYKKEHQYMVSK